MTMEPSAQSINTADVEWDKPMINPSDVEWDKPNIDANDVDWDEDNLVATGKQWLSKAKSLPISKEIWDATKELATESNLPYAIAQSTTALAAGMAGFTADIGARVVDMTKQAIGKGATGIDWMQVYRAGQEAAKAFEYTPTDAGAKQFLSLLSYIPRKGKEVFTKLADTTEAIARMKPESPDFVGSLFANEGDVDNTGSALRVAGDITELLLWGKVFKAGEALKVKQGEFVAADPGTVTLDATWAKDLVNQRRAMEAAHGQRPLATLAKKEVGIKGEVLFGAEGQRAEQQLEYDAKFTEDVAQLTKIPDRPFEGMPIILDAKKQAVENSAGGMNFEAFLEKGTEAVGGKFGVKERGIEPQKMRLGEYGQKLTDRTIPEPPKFKAEREVEAITKEGKTAEDAAVVFDEFLRDNQSIKGKEELAKRLGLLDILKSEGGAIAYPDFRRGYKSFKEFWMLFSTVPNSRAALTARYKGLGKVGQAERMVSDIHRRIDKFPPDVKKDMFKFLDGQIPIDSLPVEARLTARSVQNATTRIGQMLVKRDIISEKTFNELKGRYVHRMYAKHILGDNAEIGMKPTGKLDLTYTKRRNPDLTQEQRLALGQIEDASVAVPVGMGKALTDIAKFDYLAEIAKNPDWVWAPSIVQVQKVGGGTRKMGIGKLVEELKLYEKVKETVGTPDVIAQYNHLKTALDAARAQTANVPKDFKQFPTTRTYGPLAGTFARRPIVDDIKPLMDAVGPDFGRTASLIRSVANEGMALFKTMHVPLNVPTVFRNVGSNIIQQNMRGAPLYEVPFDVVRACESMLKKDTYYLKARKNGLFQTNWANVEIKQVLDAFSKAQKGGYASLMEATRSVAKYYGKIDDISKLAIFRRVLEKEGGDIVTATLEAQKWGMDYSLASRSIKTARRYIMPFVSYQYKIAPLIAESLIKRPWVIGKFAVLPYVAAAITRSLNDMTNEDWEKLKKTLPFYVKEEGSHIILPFKTKSGAYEWINLGYYFPWGNQLEIFKDVKDHQWADLKKDLGISNPFLTVFEMIPAKEGPLVHPFYGTEIYHRTDPPHIKATKTVEALAFTWLPSMLSSHGALGYTMDAISGDKDKWGRQVTTSQAIGRWFGANIITTSKKQTGAIKKARIGAVQEDIARAMRDPSLSSERKKQMRQEAQKQIKGIREQ